MEDLQIVLLGKTGSGKSASGNTILGQDTFYSMFSPASVTINCQQAQRGNKGERTINVIDTVGHNDIMKANIYVKTKEIFNYAGNGVNVFLLVIKLGNVFSMEEQNVVTWMQDNFGADFLKYTILLFTCEDTLHGENEKIEDYIKKCKALTSLVYQYSGRYHAFNNKDKNQDQVTKLIEKIDNLVKSNPKSRYTLNDYEKAQKELLHKKCAAGAAIGGAIGAVGGAIAAKIGAVGLTVGKIAAVGAAGAGGCAVLGVVAVVGIFYFARTHISKSKDKKE